MALPVVIILHARERAIDPRRADLEPITTRNRIAARRLGFVEPIRNAARQIGAIVDRELARVRALGHHLKRGIGRAAIQLDAHERETRSEEHTSELQSLMRNSYAVFCLKKKTHKKNKKVKY